ncbi:MAG: lamin tail domain-containing protein [Clostridia bacterium]|nr:lamin tail domain-containing protein [Clostridia bacterium]
MTQNRRPVRPAQSPAQRPVRQPAPKPASRKTRRFSAPVVDVVIIAVVLLVLGVVLQMVRPALYGTTETKGTNRITTVSEIHGSGPIRINELMASNSGTLMDEKGMSADWIELINVSGSPVNLAGYSLSKTDNGRSVYTLPEITLNGGECLVIFADSAASFEPPYHASFSLSSKGGSLMLFNSNGMAIDSLNYPAMSADMSYSRRSQSSWMVTDKPTPGMPNTDDSYALLHTPRTDAGVEICEIAASTFEYGKDENGVPRDYFVLRNTTGAAIDVGGWFVSDDPTKPCACRLPDGCVIAANGELTVYASGELRNDPAAPHVAFGLRAEGETILLSDSNGRLVDTASYELMSTDVAYIKQADGSWSTGTPTK